MSMRSANVARRKRYSLLMSGLLALGTLLALSPLLSLIWYVVKQGLPGLNLDFFLNATKPEGIPHGGMGNAIVGTGILVLVSAVISIPIGVGAGIYLAEFGKKRYGALIRFLSDVLSGVPSIVVGILVFTMMVLTMKHPSALAGGVSLAIIMIPTLTRTTEQMMRLIPNALREASYALGATQGQTIVRVLLPTAMRGITTGIILALARVMGETAPLLFTAFGSMYWSTDLNKQIAALPLQIFNYAISPYPDQQQQAWTGALVLLCIVMLVNILTRMMSRKKK